VQINPLEELQDTHTKLVEVKGNIDKFTIRVGYCNISFSVIVKININCNHLENLTTLFNQLREQSTE
jgi:hypothetical protein